MRIVDCFTIVLFAAQLAYCVKRAPLIDLGESPSNSYRGSHEREDDWVSPQVEQHRQLELSVYGSSRMSSEANDKSHGYIPNDFNVIPLNAAKHVNHPLLLDHTQYHPRVYRARMEDHMSPLDRQNDEVLYGAMQHVSQYGPKTGALLVPHHRVIYAHDRMHPSEAMRRFADLELPSLTYDEKTGKYKLLPALAIPIFKGSKVDHRQKSAE